MVRKGSRAGGGSTVEPARNAHCYHPDTECHDSRDICLQPCNARGRRVAQNARVPGRRVTHECCAVQRGRWWGGADPRFHNSALSLRQARSLGTSAISTRHVLEPRRSAGGMSWNLGDQEGHVDDPVDGDCHARRSTSAFAEHSWHPTTDDRRPSTRLTTADRRARGNSPDGAGQPWAAASASARNRIRCASMSTSCRWISARRSACSCGSARCSWPSSEALRASRSRSTNATTMLRA